MITYFDTSKRKFWGAVIQQVVLGINIWCPNQITIIPYTYNYALEEMDVIECSAKSYGYFPLKKDQREVVDIFKGERCVCVSSHSVWEKCLLQNSSKDFWFHYGTASRSVVVVVSLSDNTWWIYVLFEFKRPLQTWKLLHLSKPFYIWIQSLRHIPDKILQSNYCTTRVFTLSHDYCWICMVTLHSNETTCWIIVPQTLFFKV